MRVSIVLVLIALLGAQNLNAKTNNGLGLHFGTVSGNGFSYRAYRGNNGFQATLGAITLKEHDPYYDYDYWGQTNGPTSITLKHDDRETKINLGLNYIRSLADNPSGRFYVFGGGAYLLSIIKVTERDYILSDPGSGHYVLDSSHAPRDGHDLRSSFYAGGGLGFELHLGRGFRWAIELPITVNEDTEFTMYIPQTGIYYFFH